MIPDKLNIQITRSDEFKSTRSKIVATPDIKKVLRSKIYSNKILACLRELSCNAYDSHVEANKRDTPIEIILPSVLEPTLHIKDYGIGLDDYGVREILFSYGDPTGQNIKQTTNEEHGMYHIGAKAPLCYTNVFQVIAIKDKIKRIYTIYIGADEDDYIDQIGEELTEQENGVEIIIPVKQEDIYNFVKTAESLFKFWSPAPIVRGNSDYRPKTTEYLIKSDKWAFIKNDDYYKSSYVVMGGVPYKLNYQSIPNLQYGSVGYNILNSSVIFYADIGEVNINAGREELEYTDKTVKFIKDKISLIEFEAKKQIEDKINNVKTEYEARELFYHYFSNYGKMGSILTQILQCTNYKLKFSNKEIDRYVFDIYSLCRYFMFRLEECYGQVENRLVSHKNRHIDFFNLDKNVTIQNINKYFYNIETNDKGEKIELTKHKASRLIGYYLRKCFSSPVYDINIHVLSFETQSKFDDWLKETGVPSNLFVNLNTIVIPKTARSPLQQTRGITRNYPVDIYKDNNWKETELDIKNHSGGFYITRLYSNYYLNYNKDVKEDNDENIYHKAFEFLKKNNIMPQTIYGFTPKYIEKLDKTKWIPLHIFVKGELEKYNKKQNIDVYSYELLGLDGKESEFLNLIKNGEFCVDKSSVFGKVIKNISKEIDSFDHNIYLNNFFNLKLKQVDQKKILEIKKIIEEEINKYKILDRIHHCYWNENKDDILIYLNAKYKSLKKKEKQKLITV